jgi:HlyD family secretion protein
VKKAIVAVAVVAVVALLVFFNLRASRGSKTEVEVREVGRRDVTKVVTASGNIQPRRRVNVSASAMGKITAVAVEEGQTVERGDFLLQIDPTPYESSVDQLEAAVRGARATLELERATLKKARYDYERARQMNEKGFTSEESLRDAEIAVEIAEAKVKSATEMLSQHSANLKKARHELREVRITAEMSGVVTAVNVEEGESAIIGTINNPGTVLLTIADLSEMEAQVLVDETEVVFVELGQRAEVRLDAYPDTTFSGTVTEVANSAVRSQLGMGQESVDFKVVVSIHDTIPNIRPGLSASVDITVAEAHDALAVPIQSLTVREPSHESRAGGDSDTTAAESARERGGKSGREVEGVFVVEEGRAVFRPVHVGIVGETHFTVDSGLSEGETVVVGPFRAIGELETGDPVKVERASD